MPKFKRGFAPIIVFLILLVIASGIVYYVTRNNNKAKASSVTYPTPVGVIHISPTKFSNKASTSFSATEVYGANGAAVDNVRYYIISPKLAPNNTWGDPDWCASGGTCNQSNQGVVTYNIGAPTNGGDFHVTWDANTKTAESTQHDRGLTPANILPGMYQIGFRVQDANGVVNGNTGPVWVTITDDALPLPTPTPTPAQSCTFSPSSAFLNENVDIKTVGASGPVVLWAGPLTSTSFNVGGVILPSSFARVVVPLTVPFILPPTAPNPPTTTLGYFMVGNTKCDGLLTIKSNSFSLKFSVSSINLKMAAGGIGLKAFDLTTTSATNFDFLAPATNSLGIRFSPQADYINPGTTRPINLYADINQAPGVYTGGVYLGTGSIQGPAGIPVTVTIEPTSYDSDKDGFINSRENKIGTDPNYACKTPTGVNAWPPDVNNDGTVNTLDQSAIAGIFNARIGDSRYNRRYDLNADGAINSADLGLDASYNGKSCI